ncbi:MAG: phosphatase PAP2 family protein [Actinobacteria bacterium]|nr:phosphatase PAP2 family protein [Actinomycetota bacterium]
MARSVVPPRLTRGELVAALRVRRRFLARLGVGLLAGALLAFGFFTEGVWNSRPIIDLDRQFAELLHERATPALTYLFEAISSLGSSRTLALVALFAVVLLLSRRRLLDALLVIVALVGAEVMDAAVKAGFERERPLFDDPIVRRASGFSFPSAHAGASMALYGALAFLLARDLRSTPACVGCFVAAGLLIGAIGFSRLYLGAHYLSDVLAGFSLGLGWATLCVLLIGVARMHSDRRG